MIKLMAIGGIIMLVLTSCVNNSKQQKGVDKTTEVNTKNQQSEFKVPQVPSFLKDREAIMAFIATHYWDNFDFAQVPERVNQQFREQIFVDYIAVILQMKPAIAAVGIDSLFKKIELFPAMFPSFFELAEKYLADPNSPYRNEDLYIQVLKNTLQFSFLSEDDKVRPQYQYNLAIKNRVGDKAADIRFQFQNGKNSSLYAIKSPYTLLLFINPDCEACKTVVEQLIADNQLTRLIQLKKLKLVTLYVDEEIDLWRKQIASYPSQWLHAFDPTFTLRHSETYNLNAIPTIYLLDKEKIVILKDPIPDQLFLHLSQI